MEGPIWFLALIVRNILQNLFNWLLLLKIALFWYDVYDFRATESMASSIDSTLSTSPNGASQDMVSNDGSFSFAKVSCL